MKLSQERLWEVIEGGHTGIVASLRRDGTPVMTPVWFVVDEGQICFRTRMASKKIRRLRADPRCSFLVEFGANWRELCAAHVQGRITILSESDPRFEFLRERIDKKYANHRTQSEDMPASAKSVYEKAAAIAVLEPDRIFGWDNAVLGATPPSVEGKQRTS